MDKTKKGWRLKQIIKRMRYFKVYLKKKNKDFYKQN